MTKHIIPRKSKPSKWGEYVYARFLSRGIIGRDALIDENWKKHWRQVFKDEETGHLIKIPDYKNNSAQSFKGAGYKYSVVFQYLHLTGKGRVMLLLVEMNTGRLRSKATRKKVKSILGNRALKDITLIYNVQRGQEDNSVHMHILCYWPNRRRIPTEVSGCVVKEPIELGKGEYARFSIAVNIRKTLQYLRFPRDQRYRNYMGTIDEGLREAYEDYLELREAGFITFEESFKLAGRKNMDSLVKQMDPASFEAEKVAFAEFQYQKETHRLERQRKKWREEEEAKAVATANPYNPLKPHAESPLQTVPDEEKPLSQPCRISDSIDSLDCSEAQGEGGSLGDAYPITLPKAKLSLLCKLNLWPETQLKSQFKVK